MKYSGHIVNKICRLLSREPITVSQLCSRVGIKEPTYYYWQKTKPQFAERIQEARLRHDQMIVAECKRSLLKLIEGCEVTESKTIRIPRKNRGEITIIVSKTRHIPPSLRAIIHVLLNRDSEHWWNTLHKELTGKDGKKLDTSQILKRIEVEIIQKGLENDQK